jgi:hypothetical protein
LHNSRTAARGPLPLSTFNAADRAATPDIIAKNPV